MIDCKLMVGVCTWEGAFSKREACRHTWLKNVPDGVACRFFSEKFVGPDSNSSDMVLLDCKGTYLDLPGKVLSFYRWALENSNFEYLAKCDDDSYVVLDRLLGVLSQSDKGMLGYGLTHKDGVSFIQGGLYIIPRKYIEELVKLDINPVGYEDVDISKAMVSIGGSMISRNDLFNPESDIVPTCRNNRISCHHATPEIMWKVFSAYSKKKRFMTQCRIICGCKSRQE